MRIEQEETEVTEVMEENANHSEFVTCSFPLLLSLSVPSLASCSKHLVPLGSLHTYAPRP